MISNTCVTPPVGSGRAGTPRNNTNRIAKLFSSNSSTRLPSVLSLSPSSQASSESLTFAGRGCGIARTIERSGHELCLALVCLARLAAGGALLVGGALPLVSLDQDLIGLEPVRDRLAAAARQQRHDLADRARRRGHEDLEPGLAQGAEDRRRHFFRLRAP